MDQESKPWRYLGTTAEEQGISEEEFRKWVTAMKKLWPVVDSPRNASRNELEGH